MSAKEGFPQLRKGKASTSIQLKWSQITLLNSRRKGGGVFLLQFGSYKTDSEDY